MTKLGEKKPVSLEYQPGSPVSQDFIPRVARSLLDDLNVLRLEQKGSVVISVRQRDNVSKIERMEEFMDRCT